MEGELPIDRMASPSKCIQGRGQGSSPVACCLCLAGVTIAWDRPQLPDAFASALTPAFQQRNLRSGSSPCARLFDLDQSACRDTGLE